MNDWYEIAIVCVTIGLLIVTAINSYLFRRETKLSHKTVLVVEVFNNIDEGVLYWRLSNIGKGPATDIGITVESTEKDSRIPKLMDSERGLAIDNYIERPLHPRSVSNNLTKMPYTGLVTIHYKDMFDQMHKIEEHVRLVYYLERHD